MRSDKNTELAENPVAEAAAIDPATISGPAVDIVQSNYLKVKRLYFHKS